MAALTPAAKPAGPRRSARPRRSIRLGLILAVTAAVLAVGCGGNSGSGGYSGGSPATTAAPAATSAGGGSTTSGAGTPASGTAVAIDNFAFSPATLNAKMGQQVTWTNKQDIAHTVTADGGAFDHQMPPGATFSFTFDKAGSFAYHCTIHPSMTATIQVS